ncbi:hypothetical protein [Streptomyces sp. NPDC058426]|uniref:hypothetical protein n=1 Tax=Streptomyces sp. NPDC058426 TaxID=3346493 RepID=UPI0036613661
MFKTLLEQWQANQEQKRAIAAEKWEQEKRWRDEQREEDRQKAAEKEEIRKEKEQKQAEENARRDETYISLYRWHLGLMEKAATVSYVSLLCHEDTWTFMARRAFGAWSPEWVTSIVQDQPGQDGPTAKDRSFSKDPNLPPGRIIKQDNGMQTVELSGDNLVTILDSLWETAYGRNVYMHLTDLDPNRRACGPLYKRIETCLDGIEPGTADRPGHTLVLDERIVLPPIGQTTL